MVGVKGKYKGCNTCRGRRVKCDNTRPLCRNCVDHGRVCEGYERETVFIVGTVDDKGRCASHPPRNLAGPSGPPAASSSSSSSSSATVSVSATASPASPASPSRGLGAAKQKKKKAVRFRDTAAATTSSPSPGPGTALLSPTPASTTVPGPRDLAPVEPWAPAWSDGLALGSPRGGAGPYRVRFQAIRTRLGAVVATTAGAAAGEGGGHAPPNGIRLALPPSCRASERPRFDGPAAFRLASQCFLRPPLRASEGRAGDGVGYPGPPGATEEGSCLFLYEQNFSAVYNNHPSWAVSTTPCDDVLARGPAFFQTFPAHHFFARVYRPIAILTTLLTRTPSPLATPEWAAVPYARHPPTALDALLDTVALVPGVLADADSLLLLHHHHHGLLPPFFLDDEEKKKKARGLVARAAALEARLAAWYAGLERAAAANRAMPLLYWTVGSVDLFALAGGTKTARRRRGGPEGGGGDSAAADAATARVPFADTYEFASIVVGLGHVVYWTALMTLYECMDRLVPVVVVLGGDGEENNDGPAPGPAVLEMSGDGDGGGDGSTVRDAAASVSYGPSGLPPPACDPARYQVRERRKLAANICRSLDWVIGPSGPVVSSSSSSSVDFSSSSAFPSTTASFSSSPPSSSSSSSFSRFTVSPLSSSLSPPSSSPPPSSSSSSSFSWIPTPPLKSGSAGSVPPFSSPRPNPAMTRGGGGGSGSPGSVDPEPRAQPGRQGPETPDGPATTHRDGDGGSGGSGSGSGAGAGGGGGTCHPDLASIPLLAVERFYDGLGANDGALERAWCRGFRARLGAIGRAVDGGVGGGWFEVARFG